jgi:hypothetical protein
MTHVSATHSTAMATKPAAVFRDVISRIQVDRYRRYVVVYWSHFRVLRLVSNDLPDYTSSSSGNPFLQPL